MALLDRRVNRVPAKIGKNTRINFNKNLFFEAIIKPVDSSSDDYILDVYKT